MDALKLTTRRERENVRHRKEILAVALDFFSMRGYHSVSMKEIAHKAEYAIGTLYRFFESKADLYRALVMEFASRYHDVLIGVLAQVEDPRTVVDEYLAAKTEIFATSTGLLRLYLAERHGTSFDLAAELDQDVRQLYDDVMEKLTAVLAAGVRNKVFRDLAPRHMAVALEGMSNAFLFHWLEEPDSSPPEERPALIMDLFLAGTGVR